MTRLLQQKYRPFVLTHADANELGVGSYFHGISGHYQLGLVVRAFEVERCAIPYHELRGDPEVAYELEAEQRLYVA